MLRVNLFSHLSVFWEEHYIEGFSNRSVGALFAYLAMHPYQPQSREMLTALLYGEGPKQQARQNFRKTISRLRNLFTQEGLPSCEQILDIQDDVLTFAPQVAYEVDALAFESLWQRAQMADTAEFERSRYVAQLLRQAVQLYRGKFLPNLIIDAAPFEEWVFLTQERLAQFALTAWYHLAQHAYTIGAFEQMLVYGQKQIAYRPWHEEGHYQTMMALAALGQRTAALRQYKQCRQLLQQNLHTTPSLQTEHLHQQLQVAQREFSLFQHPTALPPHNLPSTAVPLIGRQQELEQVLDLLGDPLVRLVTLIGEGGVGKTSLARATAVRLAGLARFLPETPFPDGVWWVSLAEMRSPHTPEDGMTMLAAHLLEQLEVRWQQTRPPTAVLHDYLRERQILLVLDNYEHITSTSHLLTELLQICPQLNLLVTSRAALHLPEENLFVLHGLRVAAEAPAFRGDDAAMYDDALTLFTAVATRTTGQTWRLTADRLPRAHRLCQLVRGNPLAIELAASWVRHIPLAEVMSELEQSLARLTMPQANQHDRPARHRSMEAVFHYSWALLSPAEQELLQVIAVMQAPCPLAAIHAIQTQLAPAPHPPLWATRQTITTLINHSLVRVDEAGSGYDMHPLLRQFGQTQARANTSGWVLPAGVADGLAHLQRFHAAYFLGVAAAQEAALLGAEPYGQAVPAFMGAWDDIRQAWHTAVNQAQATPLQTALPALLRYIHLRALFFEGESMWRQLVAGVAQWPAEMRSAPEGQRVHDLAWAGLALLTAQTTSSAAAQDLIGRACQLVQDGEAICRAHLAQYDLSFNQGQWPQAKAALAVAEQWAEALDNPRLLIQVLMRQRPYFTNSLRSLEEALVRAQALPDSYLCFVVMVSLGGGAFFMGRQSRAREVWEHSLAIAQLHQNRPREAVILNNLGDIYRFFGDYERAQAAQERSLYLARQVGDRLMQMNVLEGVTRTYTSLGMYALAEGAAHACLALTQGLHKWATHAFALNALAHLYRVQGDLAGAEVVYRQVLAFVMTKPDLAHILLETYAGLAEMALAQGRLEEASTAVVAFREIENRAPVEHYMDVAWMFTVVGDVLQAQGEDEAAERYHQEVASYVTRQLQALALDRDLRAMYKARVARYLP